MTEPAGPSDADPDGAARADTVDAYGGLAAGALPTGPELDDQLLHRDLKARMFGREVDVEVGGYIVLRRIGAGGMGAVYAARDPKLQRDVALKLVLSGHRRGQERMLREARALAKLAHPNVVTIHEVGEHGDQIYLAMELVQGMSLRDWLRTPRSLREIAEVFVQAAEGLAAAHRAQLVHRDFKPDNVLIGDDGRVRVVDFGLARDAGPGESVGRLDAADPTGTLSRDVMGTPAYMAYEQLGGGEIDARTDVFAFCVSLYEAIHGHRPYDASTALDLVKTVEAGPGALAWRRDVPRGVVDLLRRGLARDPDARPSTLEPLIARLREIPSPPRRRALVVAAVIAALGGVGLLVASQPPATGGTDESAVASATPSSSPEDHICPADAPADARSCDELADALMVPAGEDDWAARCAYRRACATPDPQCPAGTEWAGTLGCVLPACEGETEEGAVARCEGGDATCCARAATFRFMTMKPGDAQTRSQVLDHLARACSASDAVACGDLATVGRMFEDDSGALSALVTSCRLGSIRSCRRIAILPEEREGLRPECTEHPGEDCPTLTRDPVQLAHYAACHTVEWEEPVALQDDELALRRALERAKVELRPGEAEAIDRAETTLRAEVVAEHRGLLQDLAGSPVDEALGLVTLANRVDDEITSAYDPAAHARAIQRLADARAGIEPARPAGRTSALDRWLILRASVATRLEDAVARELGRERAAALHGDMWPGSQVHRVQGRCPD